MKVIKPNEKTILHIPNENSRERTKDKIREVEHILEQLGEWQGTDPVTGFQLIKTKEGRVIKVADLVDEDRKSTRLNSSHVAISYAVFCLKKKKVKDKI